ncbi:hypothetical protein RB2150_03459 [Rhodobacterales bacterium HTCC2150]|nr:hypothetical protein RB2150_03459 [Rhodobacterales bacterium HTCC2150] [Rhodobacteraceae bacterium HTCC2150]
MERDDRPADFSVGNNNTADDACRLGHSGMIKPAVAQKQDKSLLLSNLCARGALA